MDQKVFKRQKGRIENKQELINFYWRVLQDDFLYPSFNGINSPLDDKVTLRDLNKYSKNYLNHLFNTNEILGLMLLTTHNINFYQQLMKQIRETITNGTFVDFHDKYINII